MTLYIPGSKYLQHVQYSNDVQLVDGQWVYLWPCMRLTSDRIEGNDGIVPPSDFEPGGGGNH